MRVVFCHSLSHTFFVLFIVDVLIGEKGLCAGGLRGKVHGRLLIITNSIN